MDNKWIILNRLKDLVKKLISVKGTIFIIATTLMFMGKLDNVIWGLSALAFVSIRMFEKIVLALIASKK